MNGFIKSCALVLAACLLAGCASAPDLPPQPTLDELLAETNAAHQAVTKPQVDASQYRTRPAPDEETVDYFTGGGQTTFDPDAVVTAAQAAEDMEYLFDAFRTLYGPYDFFGGDETFGRHKAELQARQFGAGGSTHAYCRFAARACVLPSMTSRMRTAV